MFLTAADMKTTPALQRVALGSCGGTRSLVGNMVTSHLAPDSPFKKFLLSPLNPPEAPLLRYTKKEKTNPQSPTTLTYPAGPFLAGSQQMFDPPFNWFPFRPIPSQNRLIQATLGLVIPYRPSKKAHVKIDLANSQPCKGIRIQSRFVPPTPGLGMSVALKEKTNPKELLINSSQEPSHGSPKHCSLH